MPRSASRAAIARTRSTRIRRWRGEKLDERRIGGIEEVAEHVDVTAVLDRGDLDAGNRLDASLGRGRARPPTDAATVS